MIPLKVLAIHGKMHSGKSSLSRGIRNSSLKWWHAEFKRPLVRAMFDLGFTERDLREKTDEVRRLMQALGPALLQKNPTLILDSMHTQLEHAFQHGANGVVIDDLRRRQEWDFLADLENDEKFDVRIMKIVRPNYQPPPGQNPDDPTETELDGFGERDWDMEFSMTDVGDDPTHWQSVGLAIAKHLFALPD